jgi:hypothetical protein
MFGLADGRMGHTGLDGRDSSVIRPSESHWQLAIVRLSGTVLPIVVGPLTAAGVVSWKEGAEILWRKFKLGTFMPHVPARESMNAETILPGASGYPFS